MLQSDVWMDGDGVDIRADFRRATVNGGAIELTFRVLAEDAGAFAIARMTGRRVVLAVAPEQPELAYGEE